MLIAIKNVLVNNRYFVLIVISQVLFSFLYGFKVLLRETDFGIYYVGANSITQNYGLYSGFFELKGPLYYGFIKLLSYIFPYSFFGAICVLITTCLIWFLALDLVVIYNLKSDIQRAIVALGGLTALHGQSSNASMSIFQSSIILISLAFLVQFIRVENRFYLYYSIIFGFIAVLVKIDSLVILLVICLLLFIKRIKSSLIFFVKGIAVGLLVYIGALFLLSEFLKFDYSDMWNQSVYFVLFERWGLNLTDTTTLLSPLYRSTDAITLLIISGLPFLIIFLALSFKDLKGLIHVSVSFLFLSLLFYLALNSDKDYHVFLLYPFFIMGIVWMMVDLNLDNGLLRPYAIYLILAAALLAYNSIISIGCVFTNSPCSDQFEHYVAQTKDYEDKSSAFFLNQGWPYLVVGTKPTIDFNVVWPLKVYIPGVTERIIIQANTNPNEIIWVHENMIDYYFFDDFSKNRLAGKKVGQLVPLVLFK